MKKKILIAEASGIIFQTIQAHKKASSYTIERAKDGEECLAKLGSFKPDLVIADLLLPKKHGIALLKIIKEKFPAISMIIASDQILFQNYHAAIEHGALYFLPMPFTADAFFDLLEKFENKKLAPNPFPKIPRPTVKAPENRTDTMMTFWGTRGSHPVSGVNYQRFGGNTCCLEIVNKKDRIIIDAGTGIHDLGKKLLKEKVKKIDLFISHTHLDHIIGFPFFEPIYDKDTEITIWGPVGFEQPLERIFHTMLAPSFFPIGLPEVNASLTFKEINHDVIKLGSMTIQSCYTYHPGATLGFRIDTHDQKIAYITDNELFLGHLEDPSKINPEHPLFFPHKELFEMIKSSDIVIHEAQYPDLEYTKKVGWGHSSLSNATAFVNQTKAKRWIVTHHDPNHTDEDLDRKTEDHLQALQKCNAKCRFDMAHDDMSIFI